jgi:hypothetical protein
MGTVIFSPHAYQKWCDIGYHSKPSEELYVKWVQVAKTHLSFATALLWH